MAETTAELPPLDLVNSLILASVVLTAIAAYGAIRLESRSQTSFSSQVGASFSIAGSMTTVSVDVSGDKIPQADWIFVNVYGLPAGISMTGKCANVEIPSGGALCVDDPCFYFTQVRYANVAQCAVLFNGSVVPNASGDVDETLNVPFLTVKYQDIDVRAGVCTSEGCSSGLPGQSSRFDWIILNSLNESG